MKIALYTHSLPPEVDGVSFRFAGVLRALVESNHECVVFCLQAEPHIPNRLCTSHTLGSFSTSVYPWKRLGAPSISNLAHILRVLSQERPDVLHVVSDATTPLFALAAHMLRIPIVVSIHTDVATLVRAVGAPKPLAWAVRAKERMDAWLAASNATTSSSFRHVLAIDGVHCDHVIKTAVDTALFHPERADTKLRLELTFGRPNDLLVVFVGRLSHEKGLLRLVEWVCSVDGVVLAIVGDGPLAGQLETMHGAHNRLYCKPRFCSRDEVATILATADLHATHSEFETLGNTVLEAFACGTPVLAPCASGFVDTVTHGVDGFLFSTETANMPNKNTQGISSAQANQEATSYLTQLRDDRELLIAMGHAARNKTVTRHTQLAVAADLVKWYARVCPISRPLLLESPQGNKSTDEFVCKEQHNSNEWDGIDGTLLRAKGVWGAAVAVVSPVKAVSHRNVNWPMVVSAGTMTMLLWSVHSVLAVMEAIKKRVHAMLF